MQTKFLSYDVIGKICPNGMTAENCELRKKLAELEKKYKIGYKILENGNLLVPRSAVLGSEYEDKYFEMKDLLSVCHFCYLDSRKKELENPVEYRKQPQIQTVIFSYGLSACNCPENMNCDNCPTRKMLRETEQEYHIGYKELSKDVLLVPNDHYNSKTNCYRDISQRKGDICHRCFEQAREQR